MWRGTFDFGRSDRVQMSPDAAARRSTYAKPRGGAKVPRQVVVTLLPLIHPALRLRHLPSRPPLIPQHLLRSRATFPPHPTSTLSPAASSPDHVGKTAAGRPPRRLQVRTVQAGAAWYVYIFAVVIIQNADFSGESAVGKVRICSQGSNWKS